MGGGASLGAWENNQQRDHRGGKDSKAIAYMARITGDYPDYDLTDGGEVGVMLFAKPAAADGKGIGVESGEVQPQGLWTSVLMLTKVLIERQQAEAAQNGAVTTPGGGSGMKPELLPVKKYHKVDARFAPKLEEKNKCGHDGTPTLLGQTYIEAQGTDDNSYQRLVYPIVELIADHVGSNSIYSTAVSDTYQGGIDRRINAGLHTFWWVKQRENSKWNLAWNQRKSANDATGYGFECHLGDGRGNAAQKLKMTLRQPNPDQVGLSANLIIPGNKPKTGDLSTLAYCSWLKYGHHHPGHASADKHNYGFNEEGEAINSNHIWMKAFFYFNQQFDAPLDYEPIYNIRPPRLPNRARVHFQTDPTRWHDFELGIRPDLHFWWAETVFSAPTPPPYIPDGEYIPNDGSPDYIDIFETYRVNLSPELATRLRDGNPDLSLKIPQRIKEANSPYQIGAPSIVARGEKKTKDGQEYGGEWGRPGEPGSDIHRVNPDEAAFPDLFRRRDGNTDIMGQDLDEGWDEVVPGGAPNKKMKKERVAGRERQAGNEGKTETGIKPFGFDEELSPIVAHLNFIGKIDTTQKIWDYTQDPNDSVFEGGTTDGGIWITPAEFTYNIEEPGTISDTFFGFHHSLKFGWGDVNNDNISKDGMIFDTTGASGVRDLDLKFYDTVPAQRVGTFTVYGNVTVANTGQIKVPDGTIASPAFKFTSNTGLGWYKHSNDVMGATQSINIPDDHFLYLGLANNFSIDYDSGTNSLDFITANAGEFFKFTTTNTGRVEITDGNANIFIGTDAGLNRNAGANNNVGIGEYAMDAGAAFTGDKNVGIGNKALSADTTGSVNVAIGNEAMMNTTTGVSNVAVGDRALRLNTIGHYNMAIGRQSLRNCLGGSGNTAVGENTLLMVNNSWNVAIGRAAGFSTTGARNMFLGTYAGYRQVAVSDTLLVNCTGAALADAATELSNSLIYGIFNAVTANQKLHVNANLYTPDDLYHYFGDPATPDCNIRWENNVEMEINVTTQDKDFHLTVNDGGVTKHPFFVDADVARVGMWNIAPTVAFDLTGSQRITAQLDVEGYGAIGNGSALNDRSTMIVDRDFNHTVTEVANQLEIIGHISDLATDNAFGCYMHPEGMTLSGGVDDVIATLGLYEPKINLGAFAVPYAATLFINDAPTEGSAGNYGMLDRSALSRHNNLLEIGDVLTCEAGNVSPITTKVANYVITDQDRTILADATVPATALVITLPVGAGRTGIIYEVKCIGLGAGSTCTLASGGANIDGALNYAFAAAYDSVVVRSDGTNWFIIADFP